MRHIAGLSARMAQARQVLLAMLLLVLTACDPVGENRLIERGIGTELHTADLAQASANLETYLGYMCQQGGLPGTIDAAGGSAPQCDYQQFNGSVGWTILVRAGFNDIDRRCDAYLAWLNSRRRNQGAVLAQLTDGRNFATSLMNLTGSGPNAITAAGLAFGLASRTFTNYYSRLLLEVEKSTVEIVVRERRLKFRERASRADFRINFKPDAVHVLREYLLICAPHNIENSINQRTRDSISNNVPAEANDPDQVKNSISAAPISASMRVARVTRGSDRTGTLGGTTVRRIRTAVQKALCVPADGKLGQQTTEAIRIYQYTSRLAQTGELSGRQEDTLINSSGQCTAGFENYLERNRFENRIDNTAALSQLKEDLNLLATAHGADVSISEADTLSSLRSKIATIKQKIGGDLFKTGDQSYLNRQWTPDIVELLRNL